MSTTTLIVLILWQEDRNCELSEKIISVLNTQPIKCHGWEDQICCPPEKWNICSLFFFRVTYLTNLFILLLCLVWFSPCSCIVGSEMYRVQMDSKWLQNSHLAIQWDSWPSEQSHKLSTLSSTIYEEADNDYIVIKIY